MKSARDVVDVGISGGFIEDPDYIRRYYTKGHLHIATCLDIVNPKEHLVDKFTGKTLNGFEELSKAFKTDANDATIWERSGLEKDFPLKEDIIKGFGTDRWFRRQVEIIEYYMKNVVKPDERFHVHVHRGPNGMGQNHVGKLKELLLPIIDDRITFGFGYVKEELAPGGEKLPEYYFSISLFVGFDPNLKSGQTFLVDRVVPFDVSVPEKDWEINLSQTIITPNVLKSTNDEFMLEYINIAILKGIFDQKGVPRPIMAKIVGK